jgi:hypothetical protein
VDTTLPTTVVVRRGGGQGGRLTAEEAPAAGLVNRVVEDGAALDGAIGDGPSGRRVEDTPSR